MNFVCIDFELGDKTLTLSNGEVRLKSKHCGVCCRSAPIHFVTLLHLRDRGVERSNGTTYGNIPSRPFSIIV